MIRTLLRRLLGIWSPSAVCIKHECMCSHPWHDSNACSWWPFCRCASSRWLPIPEGPWFVWRAGHGRRKRVFRLYRDRVRVG